MKARIQFGQRLGKILPGDDEFHRSLAKDGKERGAAFQWQDSAPYIDIVG
jgi:hypothetical protein